MANIMEIHKLENYDTEFIQSLIDNEIEESIHIEFKRAEALSKREAYKKEISKDVSAFANSDGGIIVYGIEEIDHKATKFSFVDGNVFTKEWLEQIISSTIKRAIPDIKIFPIRVEAQIKKTVYVVQIPSSIEAPHLTKEKRFYKRYNFQSVEMEEYEIRQLYGRRLKSKLELDNCIVTRYAGQEDKDRTKFGIKASVVNVGEVLESEFKVNFYFINLVEDLRVEWDIRGTQRDNYYTEIEENRSKITGIGKSIYPNETITVLKFDFSILNHSLEEARENLKFSFRLFYPDGKDELETKFSDIEDLFRIKLKTDN